MKKIDDAQTVYDTESELKIGLIVDRLLIYGLIEPEQYEKICEFLKIPVNDEIF